MRVRIHNNTVLEYKYINNIFTYIYYLPTRRIFNSYIQLNPCMGGEYNNTVHNEGDPAIRFMVV